MSNKFPIFFKQSFQENGSYANMSNKKKKVFWGDEHKELQTC